MKKTIVGLSVILISAFMLIISVNAQNDTRDNKKSTTEARKDCAKGPQAKGCCTMKYGSTATARSCEKTKCEGKKCTQAKCSEAKCNPAECKGGSANASRQVNKAD